MKLLPVVLCLGALAGGCSSTPQGPSFDARFNQLQAQMTTEQVKSLLGEPDLRELKDGRETWLFSSKPCEETKGTGPCGRRIVFDNKTVVEFGRDVPIAAPQPSSSVAGPESTSLTTLREIGGSCKGDGECQSKNCHFGKCAGQNNCTVSEGKMCGTDTDCCAGLCDFGICKKRR